MFHNFLKLRINDYLYNSQTNIIDTLLLKSQLETSPQLLYKFWQEYIEKYSCILEQKLIDDSKNYSFEKDVQPIIAGCLTTNNK